MITWLSDYHHTFPPVSQATPRGVLAAGGDLHPDRLLRAYREGIFPWYNHPGPIVWHAPDPRFVLFPEELKVHKSMRSYFNQKKYALSCDRYFPQVMAACGQVPRYGQDGTWINDDMLEAYTTLHQRGVAHSIEVWEEDRLVGGLYGLAVGSVFFGESMFHLRPNASKFGFIALVRMLRHHGFSLIDCQQRTQHLASLGGRGIPRSQFMEILEETVGTPMSIDWPDLFVDERWRQNK